MIENGTGGDVCDHIPCSHRPRKRANAPRVATPLPAVLNEFAFKYVRERLFKAFRLAAPEICAAREQPSLKREPYES